MNSSNPVAAVRNIVFIVNAFLVCLAGLGGLRGVFTTTTNPDREMRIPYCSIQ
jgi:hypothetical protein